jgi:hypothetical protein
LLALLLAACSSGSSGRRADGSIVDAPVTMGTDAAVDGPKKLDGGPPGVPAPRLGLSTMDVDVGTVNIGATGTGFVVVSNNGDAPSGPLAVMVNAPPDFHPRNNCMTRRLGPGETCVVTLDFQPTSVGMKTATGKVNQTEGDQTPLNFTAHGVGRLPPDAGPDVPRDVAGAEAARDVGAESAPPEPRPEPPAADARPDTTD